MSNKVRGIRNNTVLREFEIKREWTERATAKNERIVGEGYAQRQIESTLKLVDKINTNL